MSYIGPIETAGEATLRRVTRALVTAVLFVPGLLLAVDDPDLSLSAIIAEAERRSPGAYPAARGQGEVLAALSGADRLPIACATPIGLALTRPEAASSDFLRQAHSALATRPNLTDRRISPTRDGLFSIHFPGTPPSGTGLLSVDADRNGLPDLVDRVAEALQASRSFLSLRMGYPSPASVDEPLEVYLADLSHGLEGVTIPAASGVPGGRPFVVLDAGISADRITPATLHQVTHVSLLAFPVRSPEWWVEATAAFLTLAGTGDIQGVEAGVRKRLGAPGRGLAADGLLLMQGAVLWPQFLVERLGDPGVVLAIWSEMASQGIDPLSAVEAVLARAAGLSSAGAHREYAAWILHTGSRDDGLHFAFGRSLPEAPLAPIGPALPVRLDPVEPIEPLASIAFRLGADGRRGALDLQVAADGGRPGIDLLVTYGSEGSRPVLVPVPFDAAGTGRVSIPWGGAAEAWIVLRNDAHPAAGAARFSLRGSHDPYAPFDLAALAADPVGAAIVVSWTTASEKGLVGWNVYRSESPAGPFGLLHGVALPAYGDGRSEVGYLFIDQSPPPGRRVYYLVEGLTDLGLAERSHVVSGRPAPAR